MDGSLTVLMAVHNGEPFLRAAIDSILNQTYPDFGFLIVDDASTDNTRDIVRSYDDRRIELLCLESNVGQTAALNIGLRHASSRWIARMDADDYSAPTRLEEQMKTLEKDPSLACIGTHVWTFREDPAVVDGVIVTPLTHADIKQELLRQSPIIHGSIVASREALLDVGGYDEQYRHTADVELYDRLLPKYSTANIPKQLVGIRRHKGQGSRARIAFDEYIQVCSNRLRSNNYTLEEQAIIRGSLSRLHIHRARYQAAEGRLSAFAMDVSRAMRYSIRTSAACSFKVFVVYLVPERQRALLKRFLLRLTPHPGQ